MNFNNAYIVLALDSDSGLGTTGRTIIRRLRVKSGPCLPERLPSSGFIAREAEDLAPRAILKQLRRSPSPPIGSESGNETETHRERSNSVSSSNSSKSTQVLKALLARNATSGTRAWKEPQPYEIFRAVEQKDFTFLMEVRDKAFQLLLRKTGDATPLLHAMRIGATHRDVAIILLGAFSRYINHLEDEDMIKPLTKSILKALRTNLKLAIDYGLAQSQSDLTASFLQTLIMSEGEKWVRSQTEITARALRVGTASKPVATASAAVRKFATKELVRAELIASLEDYIANATFDLLMLGAWNLVLETVSASMIPAVLRQSYYFARDNRVLTAFIERLDTHQMTIQSSAGRRLKWQLRVLRTVLEGRATTFRRKVELLAGELDEGEGV